MLTNLVKGITYFKPEEFSANTVYHRIQSCGGYHVQRSCNRGRSEDKRKKRIETCYVERLIFDALYRQEQLFFPQRIAQEHSQDGDHQDRIQITKAEFQSCFPAEDLHVTIEYISNRTPTKVIIVRTRNGRIICVDEYTKEIRFNAFGFLSYGPVIECIRKEGVDQYAKVQSFVGESHWVKRIDKPQSV